MFDEQLQARQGQSFSCVVPVRVATDGQSPVWAAIANRPFRKVLTNLALASLLKLSPPICLLGSSRRAVIVLVPHKSVSPMSTPSEQL